MNWLRKLRGALGVGMTWGVGWGLIGGAIGAVLQILGPGSSIFVSPIIGWALGMSAYGLISGFGFSAILSLRDGTKQLRDLSLARVALWGVLGSISVPALFGVFGFFDPTTTVLDVLGAVGVTGALGGTFAAGSVAAARHAELEQPDDRALLTD